MEEGHPTHENPVVVPVSLSFVRAPAHPGVPGAPAHLDYLGLKGHKRVVHTHKDTEVPVFTVNTEKSAASRKSVYTVKHVISACT